LIGSIVSHYNILEKLGQGGMGVVYKAEDTNLKRFVALKFLPPNLTHNPEANERFIHEAQAASALDHPNICTIHEIAKTADGQTFIVMAFYEGQSLKEKLKQGPLDIDHAIGITADVAAGLARAHEAGIVHRDIKPANIMITDRGEVRIIDFGLAKLSGQTQLTKTGSTIGTATYMSPEQALGDPVDHRSDIWSLGVVLYEMLTGQQPFKGDVEQAVIYCIVHETSEPVDAVRPGLPSELGTVVNQLLEKDPEQRYQSMNDLRTDLKQAQKISETSSDSLPVSEQHKKTALKISVRKTRTLVLPLLALLCIVVTVVGYVAFFGGSRGPLERITLAVADFENHTNEPELDGLSDLMITTLEQSRRLEVLTRARMYNILRQAGKQETGRFDEAAARDICQQANVNTLVTSSIRKLGKLYIIDLKVFDIQKNKHLYTKSAQGQGQESVPGMIDELAKGTRKALREKDRQIQETSEKVAVITTSNLEAYSHYFAGQDTYSRGHYSEAIEKFKQAIEQDSTFGLARFWVAYATYMTSGDQKFVIEQIEAALAYSHRMPERERIILEAIKAREEKGWKAGVAVLLEMEKKYPNDIRMIHQIGNMYRSAGHLDSAVVFFEKVRMMGGTTTLGPLSLAYYTMGQYEKMLEVAKQDVSVDGNPKAYYRLAQATELSGKETEFGAGVTILKTALRFHPTDLDMFFRVGLWYYRKAQFDSAAVYFEKAMEIDNTHGRMLLFMNNTYEELGLYEKEFEVAKLMMSVKDHNEGACYYLAKASALSDRFEEGIKLLDQVRHSFPKSVNYATDFIADLYAHQGQYARAEAELNSLIRKEQPLAARRIGYENLVGVYPYLGRYRDALDAGDKVVELSWQLHDTSDAIRGLALKGLVRIWGWGEKDYDILAEEKKDSSLVSRHVSGNIWEVLSLLQFYRGDYVSADNFANHFAPKRSRFIHLLVQMKRDCAAADSIDNDPSWRSGPNYFQIQMFYQLAQCYYAAGEFDKAERAIARLQSKFEKNYPRAVFLPKSIYLEGKIHEKKGDRVKAIESYEKLLDMWKDADEDLPELIDAKARLAKLEGEA
jgi:serine/threonine protein kinase/tetratricopeptide (TPR) repeat protein